VTKIFFDVVSMNTMSWAFRVKPEGTTVTKVGISSVETDFRKRTFDTNGRSTDPVREIYMFPSKETVEINRDYPTLIDTLSDMGGIIDLIF
jgi:hypothetical protein